FANLHGSTLAQRCCGYAVSRNWCSIAPAWLIRVDLAKSGPQMDAGSICTASELNEKVQMISTTRAVWFFVAALTAIRLLLLATTDLSFDEAHYWMWSDRLAPAYFSKGPGIAFAIRAGTALFGANEFGVRFFSPVLAAGTSLLLFYFARHLFGPTAGLWAVIGLNATPIFNI